MVGPLVRPRRPFWGPWCPFWIFEVFIEGSDQKTYLTKVGQSAKKSRGRHLFRPRRPFWAPPAAILDFADGAALQAVS